MANLHPISCGCAACRGPIRTTPIVDQRNRPFWLLAAAALVLATIAALL